MGSICHCSSRENAVKKVIQESERSQDDISEQKSSLSVICAAITTILCNKAATTEYSTPHLDDQ